MQNLFNYKYLLMFDLASKKTGVCLWDIENGVPYKVTKIETNPKELQVQSLYNLLDNLLQNLQVPLEGIIVSKEAMPIQVHGGSSTIQTFVALARSHAVLDLFMAQRGIAVYDEIGVYPASTHAFFRRIKGLDKTYKIQKQDIISYVQETYNLSELTSDEADAVFLAKTLVESKYNKDIKEEIRELKRNIKKLTKQSVIDQYKQQISDLTALLRSEEGVDCHGQEDGI